MTRQAQALANAIQAVKDQSHTPEQAILVKDCFASFGSPLESHAFCLLVIAALLDQIKDQ